MSGKIVVTENGQLGSGSNANSNVAVQRRPSGESCKLCAGHLHFSGLAPGFVGEYQVNVAVPLASAKGNAVPVVTLIGGATSNTVTTAVQWRDGTAYTAGLDAIM